MEVNYENVVGVIHMYVASVGKREAKRGITQNDKILRICCSLWEVSNIRSSLTYF